ncbi:hypothetical protein D3C80_1501900 [compost metagenome]
MGSLIDHRSYQQASGTASHRVNAPRLPVPLIDQCLSGIDKVVEGVWLVRQFALLIPVLPKLTAAAYVDQRIDETTIQQANAVGAECRIHAHAIGAVAVYHQRTFARFEFGAVVYQRDRHLYSVAGGDPQTLTVIQTWFYALHLLPFQ